MGFSTWFRHAAALAAIAAFCTHASAENDIFTQWTFETSVPTTAGPHAAEVGTGSASGFHASEATVWSNPVGNGSMESFSSNNWALEDYYQFQTSTTGLIDIGLIFDHTGSSTGPRDFRIDYSINGTDFSPTGFEYSLLLSNWTSTTYRPEHTREVDLTHIAALNNQTDIFLRLVMDSSTSINGGTVATTGTSRVDNVTFLHNFVPPDPPPPPPPPPGPARLPQPGDVVFGLNRSNPATTFELVRGPASPSGGVGSQTPWQSDPSMQSVAFDNHDGILHNARGNLLAVDFGTNPNPTGDPPPPNGQGGVIYSFATRGSIPAQPGEPIGNTSNTTHNPDFPAVGHDGSLTPTRLGGISVSPDNSKIAVTGFDSRAVIVYDYTPGDTFGSGAALTGGRESASILAFGTTQGSAWLDNNTVMTFTADGDIYEVDATSMANTFKTTVPGGAPLHASEFTSLAYNPDVSPYLFASYAGFTSQQAPDPDLVENILYILDPATNYSLINEVDLSLSLPDSAREIALDRDGNLVIGTRGSAGGAHTGISIIIDVVSNPAAIADNSSVLWYETATIAGFNGLDAGHGEDLMIDPDFNGDGFVDAADYVWWRKNSGDPEGYDAWRAAFGTTSGSGSALANNAAVPEPSTVLMLFAGVLGLWLGRGRSRG